MSTNGNKYVDLVLDSGAFGAWKRGIELDLDAYIAYIKQYKDLVWTYVNMDVLPGYKGRLIRTSEAMESSAQKSYVNLQRMKDAGLSPIPVFHQGESFRWLEKLLDDGEPYIGISPYLKSHRSELRKWLDDCFTMVTDKDGYPIVKTHGFGMTSPSLVLRYPWYTCDSTSWAIGPGFGQILMPRLIKGKPDFSRTPIQIHVSGRVPDAIRQLGGLGPVERRWVEEYLANIGADIPHICNSADARRAAYVYYFQQLEELAQGIQFKHPVWGLSSRLRETVKGQELPFHFVYATSPNSNRMNLVLNNRGVRVRLLSYFELREKKDGFLEKYVATGMHGIPREFPKQKWHSEHYKGVRKLKLAERIKYYNEATENETA